MSSLLHRLVTNRHGQVAIAQPPNLPLLSWGALAIAARTPAGAHNRVVRAARDATLGWWAWREWRDGDSPFRRTLGATSLVLLAAGWLKGGRDRAGV